MTNTSTSHPIFAATDGGRESFRAQFGREPLLDNPLEAAWCRIHDKATRFQNYSRRGGSGDLEIRAEGLLDAVGILTDLIPA